MGEGYCFWLGLTIGQGGHLFLGTGVEKLHFFIGKRKKPCVVGRRNAENDENRLSSADEMQNYGKNCVSGHPDGQKNGKNCSDTGVNRQKLGNSARIRV